MNLIKQGDKKLGRKFTTKQKALKINLNQNIYGSFAEIGAGQETVRHFFLAGGASGTIAKAISAYDKIFSDEIYGVEDDNRYVTEKRLKKMLKHETDLLEERLLKDDIPERLYFSFANTVATIDFFKKYKGHGWIGVRFQTNPNEAYNEIILHTKFKENNATHQQYTIGVMGTNLVYAAYYLHHDPKELMLSLYDSLDRDQIEIDMINFSGPVFEGLDNRLMSLYLVKYNMTNAVMFSPEGKSLLPAQELYKKNVLFMRGSFRPVTKVNMDLLNKSKEIFFSDKDINPENSVVSLEITIHNLRSLNENSDEDVDDQDFLNRAELLCALGHNVMITGFREYYKFVDFISTQTKKKIRLAMGAYNMMMIFDDQYYKTVDGGIFEAVGRLMNRKTKFYLYPLKNHDTGEIICGNNVNIVEEYSFLFEYFKTKGKFIEIENYDASIMDVLTRDVYEMIRQNKTGWEVLLPEGIADLIKQKKLFGYQA